VAVTDGGVGIWKAVAYATTALKQSAEKSVAGNVTCRSTAFRDGDTENKINEGTKTNTARK